MTEGEYDFRFIYEADDVTLEAEDDLPFSNLISDCDYYEPEEFNKKILEHQVLLIAQIQPMKVLFLFISELLSLHFQLSI